MSLKSMARAVMRLFPLRNTIVFESSPPFGCNTYPVYKCMERRGFFKTYKAIWLVSNYDPEKHGVGERVRCIPSRFGGISDRLYRLFVKATAKCFISCNETLSKQQPGQLSVFLGHGSKIKKTRGSYEVGDRVDFALCQADFFYDVMAYEYNIPRDRLICLGYPRCDALFSGGAALAKLFPDLDGERVIAWLPTWRQHKNKNSGVTATHETGIPLISSAERIRELNETLKALGVHVILKPHPAQDLSFMKASSLDNFHLINDETLAEAGIQLYELLGETEALITDYSSVIFDYLLCDKPIGLTLDDYEIYKNERGFAYDVSEIFEAGEHLPEMEQLAEFIQNVADGRDSKREKRRAIRDLTNKYQDDGATERVVDFIEKELLKREVKR